ncbi:fungal-specific transcription factor domain-containing protein [Aspergillus pseudotamarii]|uniref:Fungal-specific transcription factor domain-containing protein n=1 Tax=Aspergillus pseudotamarii TaxID=132259 RepID=A0A5N6SVG4_ASPPS|nr:fungal-specific transcription factor domain-containing protein [Aspergillus pseudotamarii]KAE8137730.1 fungal-specific transcription factor domain-containing protein [Aspergillus pseudotamarii]
MKTGQECLGYGKLFIWNQGVASRGKMMGKTYAMPDHRPLTTTIEGEGNSRAWTFSCDRKPRILNPNDLWAPLYMSPVDPLFQDMNNPSRRYLCHFATILCEDLVISDVPNENPFRSLIPTCRDHPILLQIIVANAAMHISSMGRPRFDLHNGSVQGSLLDGTPVNTVSLTRYSTDSPAGATLDALSAKHKAIHLLTAALENLPSTDVDLIVTVILLFINLELIDSGKNAWRAHVEGAIALIISLKPFQKDQISPIALIRDRITSDCLTYHVLGSTLTNSPTFLDPFALPIDILRRSEANSYLSFPTTLLQILFRACELSNMALTLPASETPALINEASSLLSAAQSFNVTAWANTVEGAPTHRTPNRIHTALAHQNAVCIYIYRSITHPPPDMNSDALVTEIIYHLSFIDPKDPLSKATSWPTFIAGAETDNPVYRQWALDRLSLLWNVLPWGYVQTAVEVMQMAWRLRDKSGPDSTGVGGWVQQLKVSGNHWLIA